MNQLLSINDDTLVVNKLQLNWTTGSVTHVGNKSVQGTFSVNGEATFTNLTASGNITADTLRVKTLITESGQSVEPGSWTFNQEQDLNGKGLNWTWGNGNTQLIYRTGGRIWTNGVFDLPVSSSYNINNIPVLTAISLGPTVTNSNLTKIGTLGTLTVSGDTVLGDFAYFSTAFNRLGLGTDEPNAAIDILENNVEITIGSPSTNLATIGTYSNHDLAITTDNLARITVKNSGEVHIGDEISKTGVLRVYGSLYVDNLVTDTRLDRISPLQFKVNNDNQIYGLGLIWAGPSTNKGLTMMAGPDRLFSSEHLDIGSGKNYYINNQLVLSNTALGSGVVSSSLTTVGILESLTVDGDTTLLGSISANLGQFKSIVVNDGVSNIAISPTGISAINSVSITSGSHSVLSGASDMIIVGDKTNQRKPVKVFGPLSVNINNPDPTLSFSVAGDVSIGNKRFTNGISYPTAGNYELGDICWNTNPQTGNYIGWVCVSAGAPGQWLPFGNIASQ